MNRVFYLCIGFVLGIIVTLYLCLEEYLGKLTLIKIKKLWELLNE